MFMEGSLRVCSKTSDTWKFSCRTHPTTSHAPSRPSQCLTCHSPLPVSHRHVPAQSRALHHIFKFAVGPAPGSQSQCLSIILACQKRIRLGSHTSHSQPPSLSVPVSAAAAVSVVSCACWRAVD
eukprot:1055438-Rhodomonas_salina.1